MITGLLGLGTEYTISQQRSDMMLRVNPGELSGIVNTMSLLILRDTDYWIRNKIIMGFISEITYRERYDYYR